MAFACTARHSFLATLLLSVAPAALLAQGVASPLRDAVVRSGGRVIVTLQSASGESRLREAGSPPVTATELSAISARLEERFQLRERSRAPFVGMVMGDISPDQLAALVADPNVAAVEADRLWAPTDLGDGVDPADRWAAYRRHAADEIPYGVTNVTAPTVWAAGNRGDGVKVAAMDSGGDATHPDLSYVAGYNAISRLTSDWADDIASCNGHGTHVAGTIAALDNGSGVVGVAPRSQLYAIKVFENVSGSCLAYTSSQINGLQWAVTQGIRLVNVSIGGTYSPSYDSAIQTAAAQGTYLIAAAGNNGGALLFPGSSQYSIAVAAVDGSNTRASWSAFGPEVDFSAPGVGVNSTMPGGGYAVKSGTSMATPHVVGVSALILSALPSLTFDQLYQKLRDGALDLESAGFDNNTGYGLVRAANSLSGGTPPPPPPLVLAVSPAARNASVVQGAAAPSDQATVTLSGTNSAATLWSATKRKSWTSLVTGSGTGSGTLTWSRNATGLAVGTYVDTLTVTASGASGSPGVVYDTLRVTAAVVPVTLAVAPTSRSASVQQGSAAPSDQASVTLSGSNSASTGWMATKRKPWTTLTVGSGTGSGIVAWSRNASGLAVGSYVDTISVTATGVALPSLVFDTLRVTAVPVVLTLSVAPSARSSSVVQGGAAPSDQATVTLTGDNSGTTAWSATKRKSWTTLTSSSGTGSGTLAWSRNAAGLAVGVYLDTITVTAAGAAGSPGVVYDTLRVTAAPVPLLIAVSPTSRNVAMQQGSSPTSDQALVSQSGDGHGSSTWTATKRQSWTTLTAATGTGGGATLSWSRNATGLAVGTYVDTITVTAPNASGTANVLYDTLRVTAAPVPVTLAVAPASRSVSVQQGSAAPSDQAGITLSGTGSSTTTWSASRRQSWNTLTTSSGTGSGTVAWSRNATGLAVGTYVDTITVTAAGVATAATVYDTLRVTAAPVALTLAVSPLGRSVAVVQGSAAPADQATVTLSGSNSSTTPWTASKRTSWTTLTSGSGSGSGTLAWSRNATGLSAGTYVDTITVTATGVATPAVVFDTLRITSAPVAPTPITVLLAPGGRRVTIVQGAAAPQDSASVTLSGTGSATAVWTATRTATWASLTTPSATGNGMLRWSRAASTLAVGSYVDTIRVTAGGNTATLLDTLTITAAPQTIAVTPKGRKFRVLTAAGGSASLLESNLDSAVVVGSVAENESNLWLATTTATRFRMVTQSGELNRSMVWERLSTTLPPGLHIDSIDIRLQRDPSVRSVFVDTLEVVAVPAPEAAIAVDELFRAGSLSDDQRTVMDRDGNRNGSYDLGDLLAWIDRAHVRLSPNAAARLQGLMLKGSHPPAAALRGP